MTHDGWALVGPDGKIVVRLPRCEMDVWTSAWIPFNGSLDESILAKKAAGYSVQPVRLVVCKEGE